MSVANIIICNGRIDLEMARVPFERMRAASHCATEFVTCYRDKLTSEDIKWIAELQRDMFGVISGRKSLRVGLGFRTADELVDEIFALLEGLADRMGSKQDSQRRIGNG